MKQFIQFILKILAKAVLARHRPRIIGITGSVGKTSTKEAIYTVLASKFNARRNVKNYNNEIGLPLTILAEGSPGKSIFGWLAVVFRAGKKIIFKDQKYSKILILEMGVDRPGDMNILTDIARPQIGVITTIGQSHLEFFGTIDQIQKEKGGLVRGLKSGGWAIINYDNERARKIKEWSKVRTLTYGFDEKADVRAREVAFNFGGPEKSDSRRGVSFKLEYNGSFAPVFLANVLGDPVLYAALAGAAVGIAFGLNLMEIAEALKNFSPPKGRMNVISGLDGSMIIDDSYNASPQSMLAALTAVKKIPLEKGAKKFALIGDMLELGNVSVEEHRRIGRAAASSDIDVLAVVGQMAALAGEEAIKEGLDKKAVLYFPNSVEAGLAVKKLIGPGDLIFVKGSQGMRMEKAVWPIMAEPLRVGELLVRQDKEWAEK